MTATWYAVALAAVIGGARGVFECVFVVPLVPDPQSAIWVLLSVVTSIIIFLTVLPAAWVAFRAGRSDRPAMQIPACLPLLLLLGWYAIGFTNLVVMRAALLDAANPATGPERLRQLADYRGGPGYEVDNRVARHPRTPPDVLRSLHGRADQIGTECCLAENPRTPDDVLRDIAARNDAWADHVLTALSRNPRYEQLFPTGVSPPRGRPPAEAVGETR